MNLIKNSKYLLANGQYYSGDTNSTHVMNRFVYSKTDYNVLLIPNNMNLKYIV